MPYDENYVQTGPGEIYAFSFRTYTINGMAIPYAWRHTIKYDPSADAMPFLVETLKSRMVRVDYNPSEQLMEYGVRVSIEEGKAQGADQALDQAVAQGATQALDQAVAQAVNQGVNQSVDQGVDEGVDQAVAYAVDQGVDQAMAYAVDYGVGQAVA